MVSGNLGRTHQELTGEFRSPTHRSTSQWVMEKHGEVGWVYNKWVLYIFIYFLCNGHMYHLWVFVYVSSMGIVV
jgi:hypothetical protein